MNNICGSFDRQKIYKILHYKDLNVSSIKKYIFVGPQKNDIKYILKTLGKTGILTSSNKKRLNVVIPYYEKKFGSIIKGNTFFIYHLIDDNTNIEHLQENICVLINQEDINLDKDYSIKKQEVLLPSRQYLWYNAKNIHLNYYLELLNQIFIKTQIVSNNVFFEKLENIMMLSKKEIGNLLKELNPKKYKNNEDIKFLNLETYDYNELYNNEELLLLLNNSPVSLSNQNNIIIENNLIPFVKHINPLMTIKNKYNLDMNFMDNTTLQRSRILNYYGKIANNEINIISFSDFKDKLDTKYLKYYFPIHYIDKMKEIENLNYINKSFLIREKYSINYDTNLLENNNKTNNKTNKNKKAKKEKKKNISIDENLQKYMKIEECGIKQLDFHLNSELYMNYLNDKEMIFCFNKFKTFYDLPIIQISYNNRTEQ